MLGAQREQRQEEAALEGGAVDALVCGHRGELVGEAGEDVGVPQHVQPVEHAPRRTTSSLST
jgi:hypothetical protein